MASIYSSELKTGKIAWTVQWYDKGKQYKKYLGPISKTRAKAIKSKIENDLLDKKFATMLGKKIERITISKAFELYSNLNNLSINSIKRYNNSVQGFIKVVGDIFLDEININHLSEWKDQRLETIKPVTFNLDHRQLKAIFEWACKNKYISENPLALIKKMRVEKKIRQVLPLVEINKFFDAITDDQDKAYFLILYYTGCRPGEAALLTWKEIIKENSGVSYFVIKNTKNGVERKAVLTDSVIAILEKLPHTSERVFPHINYDKVRDRSRPNKIFKKYLDKCGLSTKYSPKWFRHNFATNSMRIGNNPTLVKDILGHSTLQTTDIYTHTDLADYKKVAELLPCPIAIQ